MQSRSKFAALSFSIVMLGGSRAGFAQRLFFTQGSPNVVAYLDTNSPPSAGVLSQRLTYLSSFDADWTAGKFCFTAPGYRVVCSDPNGANDQEVFESPSPDAHEPEHVAIDSQHHRVYWLEVYYNGGQPIIKLTSAEFDGSNVQTIYSYMPFADNVSELAIDGVRGVAYWVVNSDYTTGKRIDAVNLNGTQYRNMNPANGDYIGFIAVDAATGNIFWSQPFANKGIYRANSDGSGATRIVNAPADKIVLDSASGKVYWDVFINPSQRFAYRANLDGSAVEQLATSPGSLLAVNPNDKSLVILSSVMGSVPPITSVFQAAELQRLNTSVANPAPQLLREDMAGYTSGVAYDAASDNLFTVIHRGGYNGVTSSILRFSPGSVNSAVAILNSPSATMPYYTEIEAIAVDGDHNKIFWSTVHSDEYNPVVYTIQSCSFDGSNVHMITNALDEAAATSLALDIAHQTVYWASGLGIHQMAYDGTNQSLLSNRVASGLAVDLYSNKLYYTGYGPAHPQLFRSGLDGINEEVLVVMTSDTYSYHEGVAVDSAAGKVYWTQQDGSNYALVYTIRRANLDGSGVEI
ncbi:MAG: hypothetical protein HYR83_01380, partial [Planctomycetes bacterium]|nr:hypothetical protein [Planctomycetota bacterium]